MSTTGFDSCFYDRLDQFSRALNHVLLASAPQDEIAADEDWRRTQDLLETLATRESQSLAANSVAACLKGRPGFGANWPGVAEAVASRELDEEHRRTLHSLAWALDQERALVLARMKRGHA
jgi:hypothetical protein